MAFLLSFLFVVCLLACTLLWLIDNNAQNDIFEKLVCFLFPTTHKSKIKKHSRPEFSISFKPSALGICQLSQLYVLPCKVCISHLSIATPPPLIQKQRRRALSSAFVKLVLRLFLYCSVGKESCRSTVGIYHFALSQLPILRFLSLRRTVPFPYSLWNLPFARFWKMGLRSQHPPPVLVQRATVGISKCLYTIQ